MAHKLLRPILFTLSIFAFCSTLTAQTNLTEVNGVVYDSDTKKALAQVMVSVSDTSVISNSDGVFKLTVDNPNLPLGFQLSGYDKTQVYLHGRSNLTVYLSKSSIKSSDDEYNTPLGTNTLRNTSQAVSFYNSGEMQSTLVTSVDQALKGKSAGLRITGQSGMPGHRCFMNIRGLSSIYGNNNPLFVIDGMIHEANYNTWSVIDGFAYNPLDVIDIDDIESITVLRGPQSYLGSLAGTGIVNVNTEQKSETSTVINVNVYGGIVTAPTSQPLLNSTQYKAYLNDVISDQNLTQNQVNTYFPWLSGNANSDDYYRYNNNTNWQDEVFSPGMLNKYHIFLKGGDDIATYNISTGYLTHKGVVTNTKYSRYNLRINGNINITDKFSIIPHAKLSLSDSYVMEQGPDKITNPVLAANVKPPLMAPYTRNETDGVQLEFLDEPGVFNLSNPTAIVSNLEASNQNYHFLTSAKANYQISKKIRFSTLIGLDFNNSRDNIFIPDQGLPMVDSAKNSVAVLVTDYRSTQNHNELAYNDVLGSAHYINIKLGHRLMLNSYEYDSGHDLNTPTDDFKSLGQGADNQYLKDVLGFNNKLSWVSYYSNVNYNFLDKYYLNVAVSYEGNSALSSQNRYAIFPAISGAWRLTSERFLINNTWINDLKLRGSYGVTGNIHNSIYNYSSLYYIARRFTDIAVLTRESIPNEDLEMEKKSTIDVGLDVSLFGKSFNLNVDYYQSTVGNLIIEQELPQTYGYNTYYDNGGTMITSGIEVAFSFRKDLGNFDYSFGGTVTTQQNEITELEFLNAESELFTTPIEEGELATKKGHPVLSYYGYKREGIFQSNEEASQVTGPNGNVSRAGDIKYADRDGNNIIDERDKMIIGNPNPSLYGGFFIDLNYKNLELSADFNYSMGNEAYNYLHRVTKSMDGYENQHEDILNRWTGPGTSTEIPRVDFGDHSGNTVFSDRWIEDASYLRLGKFTVSYKVPVISRFYKNLIVYATASNLLTITSYSGYDPEFMYQNEARYMGVDYGKIPFSRSFIIGVKVGL